MDLVHPTHQHLMAIPPRISTSLSLHICLSHSYHFPIHILSAHIYPPPPYHISSFLQPAPVELGCSLNQNLTTIIYDLPIDSHISLAILLSNHITPLQTTFRLHHFMPVFLVLCLLYSCCRLCPCLFLLLFLLTIYTTYLLYCQPHSTFLC